MASSPFARVGGGPRIPSSSEWANLLELGGETDSPFARGRNRYRGQGWDTPEHVQGSTPFAGADSGEKGPSCSPEGSSGL